MSQYSSFLATAPVLQVLKPTSSPESIRQFGNPSQLAKPWFIFRRPSTTLYTPRKEAQHLEESITSVMSSTAPESVLHDDTDCVDTTATEGITAAEVPEIILYEQTDIRSSTDVTISEPPTNPELMFKASENSNADTYYVATTASGEITAAEVPEIILYEQINNRSSTDVTIFEPSTNLELSELSNQHVDSVSDIAIIGPSTNLEPIFKVSKGLSEHTNSVSDIFFGEMTHLNLSKNSEPMLAVSHVDIDYLDTTTSEEITATEVSMSPEIIHSSTDAIILGPSTSPEMIPKASKCPSQHVDFDDMALAETTPLNLSTDPDQMPSVLHTDIDFIATTTSEEIILYEQIDSRSSTNVTISEASTSPNPIFKVPECFNQHVDSVSDISSAETTYLRVSTDPESLSHKDIDCIAAMSSLEITATGVSMSPEITLYEQNEIHSSTNITICEPSTIFKVSKSSSQHVDFISDIASAETNHLRPSKTPEPMPALSHTDIDCVATKPEEITIAEVSTSPETILYEQIDIRSSTDVTILGPSAIFKVSESSSQHDGSTSTIAILGPSTNLELIDSVSEYSSQHVDPVPSIYAETTYPKLSTNPHPIPPVSHTDIHFVSTTSTKLEYMPAVSVPTPIPEEITAAEVSTIPETILYQQINIRPSTDVTILGLSTHPELIAKAPARSDQHIDCVATNTEDIVAVEVSTSPENISNKQIDIHSSTGNIVEASEHSNQAINCVSAPISAETQKNTSGLPKISDKDTDHVSDKDTDHVSDGARSLEIFLELSRHSDQDISLDSGDVTPTSLGLHGFLNGKNKAVGTRGSKKLLKSKKETTPIPSKRIIPAQPAAIAANTSRPRSRSYLPTAPQVPQRPVTRPSPPAKSALPKKFGGSRFAGSILHLPTADEDEARKRHALVSGKLTRAPKVGMSVRPQSPGLKKIAGKGQKVQERVGSNATLAVMTEVVEEDEEVAECNPAPAAEKVQEKLEGKVMEEETSAVISRLVDIAPSGVEISGAWPFSHSRNVRRKAIVWWVLDSITEEEYQEDEPPVPEVCPAQAGPVVATPKDLEEAIFNGEEEGGVSVATPSPEDKGKGTAEVDSGAGDNLAGEVPSRSIPYPVPSRWSSRIGEMRVSRRPSYDWETAWSSATSRPRPVYVERVRYPAPMRWSSRIGEVRRARTLGYAGLPPPAENPEPEVLGAPDGAFPILGGGRAERGLPVFSGLVGEAEIMPQQQEEEESSSSEWRGKEGVRAKKAGFFRRRAKQAWKKIGRVFSGGRG